MAHFTSLSESSWQGSELFAAILRLSAMWRTTDVATVVPTTGGNFRRTLRLALSHWISSWSEAQLIFYFWNRTYKFSISWFFTKNASDIWDTSPFYTKSFALFRESYAFIRESFALICESFVLFRENYAFTYAFIRKNYLIPACKIWILFGMIMWITM